MRWELLLLWVLLWSCADALNAPTYDAKADHGRSGSYPVLPKFASSKVRAPVVNFPTWSSQCTDGLPYFITPRGWKVSEPGPMILATDGTVIWSQHFANEYGGQAYDFQVQTYRGEQYLTFWLGDDTVRGHGAGHYYMLNSSYEIVRKVGAANDLFADLHDFVITPEGTGLITIYNPIGADVRPFGRKFGDVWNQAVWDCAFQEVDLETGDLLFEWRASEHLGMNSTYSKLASSTGDAGIRKNPFDWFHINSVEKDKLGNYLISARNVHAIYYIDGQTKEVLWVLGGKENRFQDLSDGYVLAYAWQHDAHFVSTDAFPETYTPTPKQDGVTTQLMTIFDNAAMDWDYTYGTPYSRVLLVEISYPSPGFPPGRTVSANLGTFKPQEGFATTPLSQQDCEKVEKINGTDPAYTVRLIREYINPHHVRSGTQGNAQLLDQGPGKDPQILAGYGINAVVTKFASNGTILCDAHFGAVTSWSSGDVQSYRAFKFPWAGRPRESPSSVMKWGKVYVSWNGATDVHSWELQFSSDGMQDWKRAVTLPKKGFETVISLDSLKQEVQPKYVRVLALDEHGQPLENGMSRHIERDYVDMFLRPHVQRSVDHPWLWLGVVLLGGTIMMWLLRKVLRRFLSRRKLGASSNVPDHRRVD